jgi:SAM-dependent methyltransferase
MAHIFRQYADYYNALYREKDYAGECDYLKALWEKFSGVPVRSVLDLGCGTGNHSYILAKKRYHVFGIDRSQEMLAYARKKMGLLPNPTQLMAADLSNFKLNRTFDAVISMFAVVGYLTDNKQLCSLFASAHDHLNAGGLFIFDVWYGPAVLRQSPENREITVDEKQGKFRRRAVPSMDYSKNVVQVDYILSTFENQPIIKESHRMRYFFIPELTLLADLHNFSLQAVYSFLSFDNPGESDWNITVVLKK